MGFCDESYSSQNMHWLEVGLVGVMVNQGHRHTAHAL